MTVELLDGALSVATRIAVTETTLLMVAGLVDAPAPVVIAEVSVTVALIVKAPIEVGSQLTVKGEVPVAMPMLVPLTVTATCESVEPAVGAAVTLIVRPAGVEKRATGDPVAGNAPGVKEMVGVARASGAASNATKVAAAARDRRRIVFMDGPPGGRLLTWRRCGCGLRRWRG